MSNKQPFYHCAQYENVSKVEQEEIVDKISRIRSVLRDTVEADNDELLFTATSDVSSRAAEVVKKIIGDRLIGGDIDVEAGDPADLM